MAEKISPREAAKHILRLKEASESFLGFVKLHHPDWSLKPFHLRLIDTLDQLERGTLIHPNKSTVYRVLINWPPRYAKSSIATKLFPAYFLARDPTRDSLISAYNQDLSEDFGVACRDYLLHPFTKQAFSAEFRKTPFEIDPTAKSKSHIRSISGGNTVFTGVGGTVTGRPANLLIIDDPVKSRREADSPSQRNHVWNYYIAALLTRKQPFDGHPAIEVVILTRWHPDDLGGRIMQTEEWAEGMWLHLKEKAIIWAPTEEVIRVDQAPPGHPYKKAPGFNQNSIIKHVEAALWEERFPLEELQRYRRLNPRDFAALYQQEPVVEGGNIIKESWWRYYDSDMKPTNFLAVVVACDTAFKSGEANDYSVAITMGLDTTGDIYILDVVRGKWDMPDLERTIVNINSQWRGKGLRGVYIEDKASGHSLIQILQQKRGIAAIAWKVVSDLYIRVQSILGMIQGGRVYLPKNAPWLDEFITETTSFQPRGTSTDDQVSALTIGLDVLSRIPVTSDELSNSPLSAIGSLNSQSKNKTGIFQNMVGTFRSWGQ